MKHETMLLWTMLALVGCASLTSSNQERLKLYKDNSTPVESFRITKLQGRQTRWSPVGDQALMVDDESDQPHLLVAGEVLRTRHREIDLDNQRVRNGDSRIRLRAADGPE